VDAGVQKSALIKINEFWDAGLRRHDVNGWSNEFFNSLLDGAISCLWKSFTIITDQ